MQAIFDNIHRVFNVFTAPFGHQFYWFDLVLWPVLMGIVALLVYKWTSNQSGIDRAKDLIKAFLLEIRIYRDDPLTVLSATARIAAQNAKYLAFNIIPMLVMMLPMLVILIQLESHFAFGPAPTHSTDVLHVVLDKGHPAADVMKVTLDVPNGIHIDAPPFEQRKEIFSGGFDSMPKATIPWHCH